MPRELDLTKLAQFEPQARRKEPEAEPEALQPWPSRETAMVDGQISIKAPVDVINRFKKMCKDDRRTYADMLGILMNSFDHRERGPD